MPIDFPDSPSLNDVFTVDGRSWKWNGTAWIFIGNPGPANELTVGTVTTGDAGTNAEVEITGTSPEQTINFTIPRGDQGETGPAGQGFPAGGTAGQVLSKSSGTDYDTEWVDQSAGITTGKAIAMAMVFG